MGAHVLDNIDCSLRRFGHRFHETQLAHVNHAVWLSGPFQVRNKAVLIRLPYTLSDHHTSGRIRMPHHFRQDTSPFRARKNKQGSLDHSGHFMAQVHACLIQP